MSQDPCNVCGAYDVPRMSLALANEEPDGELRFSCCAPCFAHLCGTIAERDAETVMSENG
jgi:hypothetical protein